MLFLNLYSNIPGTPIPGAYMIIVIVFFFFVIIDQIRKPSKNIVKRPPKIGIRGYEMIYTDQKDVEKKENVDYGRLLKSSKYSIYGKPDYIFRKIKGRDLIPLELKSASIGYRQEPHLGDLLQLAAYFEIIEYEYGTKPKEGRLIYSDAMFIVKNTKELHSGLEQVIQYMHDMLKCKGDGFDAEPSFAKCRYCKCRDTVCEFYDGQE